MSKIELMARVVTSAVLGVTSPVLAVTEAVAQDPPSVTLDQPDVAFPEPFSSITGLRELSDGRVLVSDRLEQALRVLDFGAGTYRQIGRSGQGPGEYRMPGDLVGLPGDSTLLVDFGNRRLTLIDPQLRLVGSLPLRHASGLMVRPRAVDGSGRFYFDQAGVLTVEEGPGGASTRIASDSTPILRWDRDRDVIDTLALIRVPDMSAVLRERRPGPGSFGTMAAARAFAPRDAWSVAIDGRLGIARVDVDRPGQYRVEWREPDGSVTMGAPVSFEPLAVTREDKEAWADDLVANAVVAIRVDNGRRSQGRTMSPPRPEIDEIEFPEIKPPFPAAAARVTPEGELWVRRHVPPDQPPEFDVFDSRGRRVRRVTLAPGRELIGFGQGTLYAVRRDEDDLQWLERYRR